MNKLIRLLAEQAEFSEVDLHIQGDNFQRFAELIIGECLSQVDKVDAMLEDDQEKTGVAWVGYAIAKHFGVEE